MTRYTVVWSKGAIGELAELWMASSERQKLATAADDIDWQLASDASRKGVDVSDGLRGLFIPPLRVVFSVNEEDRIVEVLRVRSC